jgi:hypothetical protein
MLYNEQQNVLQCGNSFRRMLKKISSSHLVLIHISKHFLSILYICLRVGINTGYATYRKSLLTSQMLHREIIAT